MTRRRPDFQKRKTATSDEVYYDLLALGKHYRLESRRSSDYIERFDTIEQLVGEWFGSHQADEFATICNQYAERNSS